MVQEIHRTPLLHCFFGSIERNEIDFKGPIARLPFSGLPSVSMASRKQFDLYPCFHPRNTSSGASTFYEHTISQLCTGLISDLGLYPRADIRETEAAEGKSGTYDMKRDCNDPTVVGTSHMADAIILKTAE